MGLILQSISKIEENESIGGEMVLKLWIKQEKNIFEVYNSTHLKEFVQKKKNDQSFINVTWLIARNLNLSNVEHHQEKHLADMVKGACQILEAKSMLYLPELIQSLFNLMSKEKLLEL